MKEQQTQPKDNFHAWLLQQITTVGNYLCVESNPLAYIELQGKLDILQGVLLQYLNYAYGDKTTKDNINDIIC